MSGARRKTKYRKNVTSEYLNELPLPDAEKGEEIVVLVKSHGSNILEIATASGETSLCRLPTKFRRLIWVKKGDYMIVSGSSEDYETAKGSKGRVNFQVERILSADQVKHIAKQGLWPEAFAHALAGRGSGVATAGVEAVSKSVKGVSVSKVLGAGGKVVEDGASSNLVGVDAEVGLEDELGASASEGTGALDTASAAAAAAAVASTAVAGGDAATVKHGGACTIPEAGLAAGGESRRSVDRVKCCLLRSS